jgi:O-antigen/teichoic acid export membrane protein
MLAWQLQETLRRGLMARLRHRDALPGDAVAYLGRAAVILGLAQLGALSLGTAFLAMAATALGGALLQAWQLRPRRPRAAALRATLGAHWRLGRWMALTGLVTLFAVQAVPWTLGAAHGMAPVAEFAALEQVMGVANPVLIGLAGLIVPAVAAAVPQGMAAVRRAAWGFGLQGGALLVPFCAAVLLAPETAIRLVTFNDAYAGLGGALRPIAVAWTLLLPAMVAQALLNGLGRPRAGFAAQAVFAATTVVVTLPAAIAFGLPGAAWAGLVPAAAFAGVSVWLAWRATAVAVAPAPRGMVPAPDQARAVG